MSATARPTDSCRLPDGARRLIGRFRRRWWALAAARGCGLVACAAGVAFAIAVLLDRFALLETWHRVALTSGVAAVVLLAIVRWLVVPLGRPVRAPRIARALEAAFPDLEGRLLSSVELAADPNDRRRCSPDLVALLDAETATRCAQADLRTVLPSRPAVVALAIGAIGLSAPACVAVADPSGFAMLATRFARPTQELSRPSHVELIVAPGSTAIARGADVDLVVTAARGRPREIIVEMRTDGSGWRAVSASQTVDGEANAHALSTSWRHRIAAIDERIEYRVTGGDFRSPTFAITPRDPPRPASFEITYRFPAYAGRDEQTESRQRGDLTALRGSRAAVSVTTQQSIATGEIVLSPAGSAADANAVRIRGELGGAHRVLFPAVPIDSDGSYRVELVGPDGVRGASSDYTVRARRDAPPRASIVAPRAAEVEVEPTGTLRVAYRVEDDVGVAAADLVLGTGDDATIVSLVDAPQPRGRELLVDREHVLSVARLGLEPGRSIDLALRVRDGLGQEETSAPRTLRAAYPPDAPEGAGWLAGFSQLRDAMRRLDATSVAPPTAPNAVVEWRVLASVAARIAGDLATRSGLPSADARALEGLAFELAEFVDDDCAALFSAASSSDADAAARAYVRSRERLAKLVTSTEDLYLAEALEEHHEVARLLAVDIHQLVRDLDAADGTTTNALHAARIAALGAETVTLAARLGGLGEGPDAAPPRRAVAFAGHSRALASAVTVELESAREATTLRAAHDALARAGRACERRVLALDADRDQAERRAAVACRALRPSIDVGAHIDAIARLVATSGNDDDTSDRRLALLRASRRALAELRWLQSTGQSREYADFESASLLEAVRDLIERAVDDALRASSSRTAGADEARFLNELAAAWRAVRPAILLGRLVQDADGIAASEAELAQRARKLEGGEERAAGAVRRTAGELRAALELLLVDLETLAPASNAVENAASDVEAGRRLVEEAATAAGDSRRALDTRPLDADAVRAQIEKAARLLDDAVVRLESARRDELASIDATRRWLAEQRGSLPQRLLRLATSFERSVRAIRAGSGASALVGPEADDRLAAIIVEHDDNTRRATAVARELGRETERLIASDGTPGRVRAFDRAARRLRSIIGTLLSAARGSLEASLTTDREDRLLLFAAASDRLETAATETVTLAEALEIAGDAAIDTLEGDELAALLRDAQEAASEEDADPDEIARRARRLLDASLAAAKAIGGSLDGQGREEILTELSAAATHFRNALTLAEQKDGPSAAAALRAGLDRFREAIALAKRLRGEAQDALDGPRKSGDDDNGESPAAEDEVSQELAATRAELEKLLALYAREKEADRLLEELLGRKARGDEPTPDELDAAAREEDRLADDIADQSMGTDELVRLVAGLARIERTGREVAGEERYVEEEARSILASGARPERARRLGELVPRQRSVLVRAEGMTKEYTALGFKLSIVLPEVFKAFRAGAAMTEPLLGDLRSAVDAMAAANADKTVGATHDANTKLGEFLGAVDATRRRALEAIAAASNESGAANAQRSLQEAVRQSRQAAKLMRGGQLESARRQQAAATKNLLAAGRALRRRLEQLALPGGDEGPLVSRLLAEEAARHGLVWEIATRGESFAAKDEDDAGLADLPYPLRYRTLVRIYLDAIARQEK